MDKVDKLEKAMKQFRAEVEMKFKIMQQILTAKDEQVTAKKKLLDREHTLYKTLLGHWRNTAVLAESELSLNFAVDAEDTDNTDLEEPSFHDEEYDGPMSRSKGRKSRKRKKRSRKGNGESDDDMHTRPSDSEISRDPEDHEFMEVEVSPRDTDNNEYESETLSVGKRVYVEYNKTKTGKNSTNSVWNSFLREENGQSALCRLCDQKGIQKILKTAGGSTSGLRNHLKSVHNINLMSLTPATTSLQVPSSAEESEKHPRERKFPSSIWMYYSRVESSEGISSQCNLCAKDGTEKLFKAQKGGSTTGLRRHLQRVHEIDLESGDQPGDADPDFVPKTSQGSTETEHLVPPEPASEEKGEGTSSSIPPQAQDFLAASQAEWPASYQSWTA